MKSAYKRLKFILCLSLALWGVTSLSSFQPESSHFNNEYQHKLFCSWQQRSDFPSEGPANLSRSMISITFYNPETKQTAVADMHLHDGKIVSQSERIDLIKTERNLERKEQLFRPFLEQLLFRLNSSHPFFPADFIKGLNLELTLGELTDTAKITGHLKPAETGDRLNVTSGTFIELSQGKYRYDLMINKEQLLQVTFDDENDYEIMAGELTFKEMNSSKPDQVEISSRRRQYSYYTVPPKPSRPPVKDKPYRISQYPEPLLPELPSHFAVYDLKTFIENYKDHRWSRELLHNKIADREHFIKGEFPHHTVYKSQNDFKLEIDPFHYGLSGDLKIEKRNLRDGILFTSSDNYQITAAKEVVLATGETVSLQDLSREDIETIAPFMNQLVMMHRVLSTKLLNFLLVPADVPTILVIRDPERDIIEIDSYTDLILMLSRYWLDRNIYFNIDTVKKINDYIEISSSLVAHENGKEEFDFAEILFSLNRNYRIDIAMVIIHTDIKPES